LLVSDIEDGIIDTTIGDKHAIQANLMTIAAILCFTIGLLSLDIRRFLIFGSLPILC
jgi:hypothetical protein